MKYFVSICLILISVFCSPAQSYARDRDTIRIGYIDEPKKFDLLTYPNETADRILYYNVYQGLTYFDDAGDVQPLLATKWTHYRNNTIWTFTIRENVFFHSGLLLSPKDVAFSIKMIAGLTKDKQAKQFLPAKLIKSVKVMRNNQVRVVLNESYANLPQLLAEYVVVSEHTYKNNYKNPDGTGPFRFFKYVRGHHLVLIRNETYWGRHARLKNIQWLFFKEDETQIMALKSGNIDVIPNFTLEYDNAINAHIYNISYGNTQAKIVMAFNHRGALKDVNLRRAISNALSREEINKVLNKETGSLIGSYYTKAQPHYQDLSKVNDNDISKAKYYMGRVKHMPKVLRLVVPPFNYATKIADIVQNRLAKIGLTVKVQRVSFPLWLKNVYKRHKYDMTVIMHTSAFDIDHLADKDYYWGYDNPHVANLIDQWHKTGNKKYIIEMQKIIANDSVHAFFYTNPYIVVYNKHIRNLPIHSYEQQFILDRVEWK